MRKVVWLLLLSVVSSNEAAEWVEIGASNDGAVTVYAKPSSLRKRGDMAEIWWLSDLKQAQQTGNGKPYLSTKLQYAFACEEAQSRTLAMYSYSGHMGGGKVIQREDFEFQGWAAIPPDSIYEIVWKFACKQR